MLLPVFVRQFNRNVVRHFTLCTGWFVLINTFMTMVCQLYIIIIITIIILWESSGGILVKDCFFQKCFRSFSVKLNPLQVLSYSPTG